MRPGHGPLLEQFIRGHDVARVVVRTTVAIMLAGYFALHTAADAAAALPDEAASIAQERAAASNQPATDQQLDEADAGAVTATEEPAPTPVVDSDATPEATATPAPEPSTTPTPAPATIDGPASTAPTSDAALEPETTDAGTTDATAPTDGAPPADTALTDPALTDPALTDAIGTDATGTDATGIDATPTGTEPETTVVPAPAAEPVAAASTVVAGPAPNATAPSSAEPDSLGETAAGELSVPDAATAGSDATGPSAAGSPVAMRTRGGTGGAGGGAESIPDQMSGADPSSVQSAATMVTTLPAARPALTLRPLSAMRCPDDRAEPDRADAPKAGILPPGAVEGATVVLGAPRVSSAVSVAVEFGRAGHGWAGALVFNVWLRRQMRERRLTQRQLAALSGINHSTISRLLRNGRTPSLQTAAKLAHALRLRWSDEQVAAYFDLLDDQPTLPTHRVEAALRGDESLSEEDVRAIMGAYLRRRVLRRPRVLPSLLEREAVDAQPLERTADP